MHGLVLWVPWLVGFAVIVFWLFVAVLLLVGFLGGLLGAGIVEESGAPAEVLSFHGRER